MEKRAQRNNRARASISQQPLTPTARVSDEAGTETETEAGAEPEAEAAYVVICFHLSSISSQPGLERRLTKSYIIPLRCPYGRARNNLCNIEA